MTVPTIGLVNSALTCTSHPMPVDWCDHIKALILSGDDAILLYKGVTIDVPIHPTAQIFVEVQLLTGDEFGQSALMRMNFAPEFGRPYFINLGFWNPGEGIRSIRAVILDYMKSNLSPEDSLALNSVMPIKTKCPATIHGLQESRIVATLSPDSEWRFKCLWNIVMEKACTPCMEQSAPDPNNFGVDPSVVANQGFARPF